MMNEDVGLLTGGEGRKEGTLTRAKDIACCSEGHRCELALAIGAWSTILASPDFVYDTIETNRYEDDEQKQYLAPGVFRQHSERSNDWRLEGLVDSTCMHL